MKVPTQHSSLLHRLLVTAPLLLLSGGPTSALPQVSTVPLGSNDCARWPGYLDFDYTSAVHLVVESAENTTVNGLRTTLQEIVLPGTETTDNPTGTRAIRLVVCLPGTDESLCAGPPLAAYLRPTYRCESGQLHLNTEQATTGTSRTPDQVGSGNTLGLAVSDLISIHRDYQNAFAILGEDGLRIAPYHHEIDGVEGRDVYLGTRGRTTWGFHYVASPGFFEIKLQGGSPDEYDGVSVKGSDPEFYGFLKVVPVEK